MQLDDGEDRRHEFLWCLLKTRGIGDAGAEPDREFPFDGEAIEPRRIQGRSVRVDFRGVKVAEDGLIETELGTVPEAYSLQIEFARLRQARGEELAGYKIGCLNATVRRPIVFLENEPGAMGVIVGELAARETENVGLVQID